MTNALPAGISPEDEISVLWHRDLEGATKIVASLGGAKITIETDDEESAAIIPWLVAATPNILEASWAEIEAQEKTDTQEEA